jgi:hypothetical protein
MEMGIWYMRDNHSFIKLDELPVEQALDICADESEQDGCGFVGIKDGERTVEVFQWRRGEPWRSKVREMLHWCAP